MRKTKKLDTHICDTSGAPRTIRLIGFGLSRRGILRKQFIVDAPLICVGREQIARLRKPGEKIVKLTVSLRATAEELLK